jgi:hypothetical protein
MTKVTEENLFYKSPLWTYSTSRESESPGCVPENTSNRVVALKKVSVRSSRVIDAGLPIKKVSLGSRIESSCARGVLDLGDWFLVSLRALPDVSLLQTTITSKRACLHVQEETDVSEFRSLLIIRVLWRQEIDTSKREREREKKTL